jgi:O2-independent ubiquinone biosynthesis accessory factor UbiT
MSDPIHEPRLRAIRRLIDRLDDAMLVLLAGRRQLVGHAARVKRAAGIPLRDPQREGRVRRRALRLSRLLALPAASVDAMSSLLIADACQLQGLSTPAALLPPESARNPVMSDLPVLLPSSPAEPAGRPRLLPSPDRLLPLLRLLPPPARIAPLLRLLPAALQCRVLDPVLRHALARPLQDDSLQPIEGRWLGISVDDLGLGWSLSVQDGGIQVEPGLARAESCVHGSATDLLLLASRLEDADTLFFQRRLRLTGDTELGLTARNMLDQLPWEDIPLAARILLHRTARFARLAREQYRDGRSAANGPSGTTAPSAPAGRTA